MKPILAVATLALVALVLEDKARQLAGDAQDAYGEAAKHVRASSETLSTKVSEQPIVGVLVAAGLGYALSRILPL